MKIDLSGLAKRVAGTGVTVNAVLPGPTQTEGVKAMLKDNADQAGLSIEQAGTVFVKEQRSSSIIQRLAKVDEVANMVVYVCSPTSVRNDRRRATRGRRCAQYHRLIRFRHSPLSVRPERQAVR